MTNKIKIGEREYSTPFSYNINEQSIYSADGWRVCEAFNDSFGAFIVSALNDREEWKTGKPQQTGRYIIQLVGGDMDIDSFHAECGWHSYGETMYGDTSKQIVAYRKLPRGYTE
jgi:hypothetical protein